MTKMKVITHKRLQNYEHHYGMVCLTGMLGCRWHRYQQSQEPSTVCDILWYIAMLATSLFTLFWFYFWLLAENSWNNLNWFFYDHSGTWRDIYAIIFIITCVLLTYVGIINILALCHLGHGHQVHIHWVHKFLIVLILAVAIVMAIAVTHQWSSGWLLQKEALMITGPFLHLGAVVLMTGLSWFVAGYWVSLCKTAARVLYLGTFIAVMVFLYAVPVMIDSPCITDDFTAYAKPRLIGHRGLPSLRPENTKYSFKTAKPYVITWESDVTVSYDGVPFLMHDTTLKRTTDVEKRYPDMADEAACWFNMSMINSLDAGSWFIKTDPFKRKKKLSKTEQDNCINQTVPTLKWLLDAAQSDDRNIMFDIKRTSQCGGHPYERKFEEIILNTILDSGINPEKVWWLVGENGSHPLAVNLTQVMSQKSSSKPLTPKQLLALNIRIVNAEFGVIPLKDIRDYQEAGIAVNIYVVDSPWLYSLYWCMGVDSVTTNQADYLASLIKPVWVLNSHQFHGMWVTADIVSVAVIILFFVIHHLCKAGKKMRKPENSERLSLQGPKIRMTHLSKNKNMKEKLLHTAESFPDIDPATLGISNEELAATDDKEVTHSTSSQGQLASPSRENGSAVQPTIPSRYSTASGLSGISAISGTEVGNSSFTSVPPCDSGLASVPLSNLRMHIVLANDVESAVSQGDGFTDVSLEASA